MKKYSKDIPVIPSKSILTPKLDADFGKQRQDQLNIFLSHIGGLVPTTDSLFSVGNTKRGSTALNDAPIMIQTLFFQFVDIQGCAIGYLFDEFDSIMMHHFFQGPESHVFYHYFRYVRNEKSRISHLLMCEEDKMKTFESKSSNSTNMSKEEMQWYSNYYQQTEQWKQELTKLRLAGDVFVISMQNGKSYLMNVATHGKVYIYPSRLIMNLAELASWLQRVDFSVDSYVSKSGINNMMIVTTSQPDPVRSGLSISDARYMALSKTPNLSKLSFMVDEIASINILHNTFDQNGMESALIFFKGSSDHILFSCHERHEILEVLGIHSNS